MKSPLRWRILLFTAVPMVVLTLATLWIVHDTVSRRVHDRVEEDLRRAAAVFEDMLGERAEQLGVTSDVIVRDPRFFAVLTLPGSHNDPVYRNTVAGVARDFNAITHADLFEVIDVGGRSVASAGRDRAPEVARSELVKAAADGRQAQGVIRAGRRHFQATATPVVAGGRIAGVLVVGARVGQELAEKLRALTRSDVSFVSGGALSGSTLDEGPARAALLGLLATSRPGRPDVSEVQGADGIALTLARALPGSRPIDRQFYAIQRSLPAETVFLAQIQSALAQLGLLAILVAIVAGLLVARRITEPLQRIVRAAEEIERGNYDFPVSAGADPGAHDEIGYLARRFELMRQHERAYVRRLEEVARLKSEFISVWSHELRTPISVIRGYQELLVQRIMGSLSEPQEKAIVAIGEAAAQLEKVADNATNMAQIQSERFVLEIDAHDVAELVKASVRAATEQARGRHVGVTLELERDLPLLMVDGPRMIEAVGNLVKNALRFTPDGGRVEVRTRWLDPWLEIEVEDDGIGIAPERHLQIFEMGSSVRDSRNHHSSTTLEFDSAGLGLGLAIARGIVEAHDGSITVDSAPGRGSRFVVRLRPAVAEHEHREAA